LPCGVMESTFRSAVPTHPFGRSTGDRAPPPFDSQRPRAPQHRAPSRPITVAQRQPAPARPRRLIRTALCRSPTAHAPRSP
jgi:hypothetical protein